ncbi:MAG: acyl-CoA dehydrogenase family protein [Sporichthyaceae bacterium]
MATKVPAEFWAEVAAWLEREVPERWRTARASLSAHEETEIRREWDRKLFAAGYSMLTLAPEYGGRGFGLADEVRFGELCAIAHAPDSLARVGKILTAPALIVHGTDTQRARFLPRIVSGEDVWCQGFSEPGSGSDLASVTCEARKVAGGYRVTGQKVWTSFAEDSHRCLMLVRTDPTARRYQNLSLLLLDMSQPGVTVATLKQISGSMHFAEVFFDEVFVADEDRLGPEGAGWTVAMTILTAERGGVETVTRYVDMRADIDKLLGCCVAGSPLAAQAEDLDTETELVRRQVAKAIEREHDEDAFNRATCFLKVLWSDLWQRITALGLDSGCAVHRDHWNFQYLEVKGTTIYSGTNQIQRNIIAERVLGLPK